MVATVESPAIAPSRPRQYSYSGGKLSAEQKLRIRTLYLSHNLGPKEISDQLKCDYRATRAIISTAGWAKLRGKRWEKAEAEVNNVVEKDLAEVSQQIIVNSEELTHGSLELLRQSLAPDSPEMAALPLEKRLKFMADRAKTAQMASGAARNLVDIARRCRGLDNKVEQSTGTITNVNLFMIKGTDRQEKNVTPSSIAIG